MVPVQHRTNKQTNKRTDRQTDTKVRKQERLVILLNNETFLQVNIKTYGYYGSILLKSIKHINMVGYNKKTSTVNNNHK